MNKEKLGVAMANLFHDHDEFGKQPLVCELSDFDEDGNHNCMACNLATSCLTLESLYNNLDHNMAEEFIYRIYLPQIYLICEEIDTILRECGIPYNNRPKQFNAISTIKKLMNFEKHPKRKVFFSHPTYQFVPWKEAIEYPCSLAEPREYLCFRDIKKYYSNSRTLNKDSESVSELFCGVNEILIILPEISSIIDELSYMMMALLDIDKIKDLSSKELYRGRLDYLIIEE